MGLAKMRDRVMLPRTAVRIISVLAVTQQGPSWTHPRDEHVSSCDRLIEDGPRIPHQNARPGRVLTNDPPARRLLPEEETHHAKYPWLRARGSDQLAKAGRLLCLRGPLSDRPSSAEPSKDADANQSASLKR